MLVTGSLCADEEFDNIFFLCAKDGPYSGQAGTAGVLQVH